ncbi:4-galactosyl-N-acetylglucosaminide 3-alpha-L-fucosyltransferase 9-like [Symphorus nematophorus]
MLSSACQWMSPRTIVCSSLVVLCFLVVFYAYSADINFRGFGIYIGGETENWIRNCSAEPHKDPNPNDTQANAAAAALDAEPDTILLIWPWPFGYKFDSNCIMYNITKCQLTGDRTLYSKARGVLLHHRDIYGGLPTEPRPCFQKWVWLNMESPANSAPIPHVNNIFNLTCNYRLDSNIPVPYGYMVPVTPKDESFKLPAKDKLVCWVITNWSSQSKRVLFYNELKKYAKVDGYGTAFGSYLSNEEYPKIVSSCKFYLSFENSVYKDYITEKLYGPMTLGTVPIVMGPSRQNYEDHIPGDSFIHVNDFSTPKQLAERLIYLDRNPAEYMKYFEWTNKFRVKRSTFGKEHACKTCHYLQKHTEYQAFHDLNKWYWG